MKMAGFSFVFLFLLLYFPFSSFAHIETGNATAKTTVKSTSNGGSSTTHIETTVNGKTKTIDSNSEGTIEVINKNGNVTVNKSPEVTLILSPTKTSTPTPSIAPEHENKIPFVSNFLEGISNFFKRIFANL